MTTEQLYNKFVSDLSSIYDEREADNITDWTFEKITGQKKLERRINKNLEIKSEYAYQLERSLKILLRHTPVQYVLNEAWFYKMKFIVDEHVLIPRPETEELVSWIINDVKSNGKKTDLKIIDIGTGSGCIAIALKKNIGIAEITAIDISENALMVAKKNADALHAKVNFLQLDFIQMDTWDTLDRYDIIVSNPPYIPLIEKGKMAKNVIDFEPSTALFVNDNDPFIFYEKISKFAQMHLQTDGIIYVEIHEEYAKEIEIIFEGYNFKTQTEKDIYGKNRMIKAFF